MKTIGIVGGIAPGSTIEYYRLLVDEYRARTQDNSYPPIIINSINMTKMLDLIGAKQLTETADYIAGAVHALVAAGAEIGLLASNTPHIAFDEIQRRSPIPLVSIVTSACDFAKARGLLRLGLFGTRFTMQGGFYAEVFAREGLTVVLPSAAEQEYIHDKYMGELVKAIFLPETKAELLAIVERFKVREGIDGIILGGTELPLILRADSAHGIPLLDTGCIHVEAVLNAAMA